MPNATKITLPVSGNPSTTVPDRGKVYWYNGTGAPVTSFTLPTCVSPQTGPTLPLADQASTRDYEINNGSKGSYGYGWGPGGDSAEPRNGTIDVGAGTEAKY